MTSMKHITARTIWNMVLTQVLNLHIVQNICEHLFVKIVYSYNNCTMYKMHKKEMHSIKSLVPAQRVSLIENISTCACVKTVNSNVSNRWQGQRMIKLPALKWQVMCVPNVKKYGQINNSINAKQVE